MPRSRLVSGRSALILFIAAKRTSEQDNPNDSVKPGRISHWKRGIQATDTLGVAVVCQTLLVGVTAFVLFLLLNADLRTRVTIEPNLAVVAVYRKEPR